MPKGFDGGKHDAKWAIDEVFGQRPKAGCITLLNKIPRGGACASAKILRLSFVDAKIRRNSGPRERTRRGRLLGKRPRQLGSGYSLQTIARTRFADGESRVEDPGQDGCFKPSGLHAGVGDATSAQSKDVGEFGNDFFDMMRDKHQGRRPLPQGEFAKVAEKSLAGDGIEASARFVENQDDRIGHQCACNQNTLAFALGKHFPSAFGSLRDP